MAAEPVVPFPYDLPRLLWLRERIRSLAAQREPAVEVLRPPGEAPRRLGVLAGSFNPLTRGHTALIDAARTEVDAVLVVMPLQAVDKESVTRAAPEDRALVLLEWAQHGAGIGVALVNRGLYVQQAALLAAQYPASELIFLVGHDKIVQIFDPRYYAARDAALRELFGLATFRVAPRAGQDEGALQALLDCEENRPFAPGVAPLAVSEDVDTLSSSAVREAARTGEPWDALVPSETARFMRETLPYSPPTRLPNGEEIDAYGLRLALIEAAAAGRLDPGTSAHFMDECRKHRL